MEWQPIKTAPKDGQIVLVWYDHDADPYQDPHDPDRLTDYGAWCDGGDFMTGQGYCFAQWEAATFEAEDEYGSGYWLPAWWFKQDDTYTIAVNPTHWMPLPAPPET